MVERIRRTKRLNSKRLNSKRLNSRRRTKLVNRRRSMKRRSKFVNRRRSMKRDIKFGGGYGEHVRKTLEEKVDSFLDKFIFKDTSTTGHVYRKYGILNAMKSNDVTPDIMLSIIDERPEFNTDNTEFKTKVLELIRDNKPMARMAGPTILD